MAHYPFLDTLFDEGGAPPSGNIVRPWQGQAPLPFGGETPASRARDAPKDGNFGRIWKGGTGSPGTLPVHTIHGTEEKSQ